MKILCFLLVVVIATVSEANLNEWHIFKQTHGKNYKSSAEEVFRKNIFDMNKQMIDEHNDKFQQGLVSYSLKMNHFGDLMHHEFKAMMNGYNRSTSNTRRGGTSYVLHEGADLPETVDWIAKGAVTPVKNQLLCGSCWAFSATGALEGQHFLKTGEKVSLSEQQLIDCSRKYDNRGCFGGYMEYAFKYIKENGGLDTESSYGYWGLDLWCRFKKSKVGATISGYVNIPEGDEEALKSAVATSGPVSVSIDASQAAFQFYYRGVYDDSSCSSSALDHGVLVVGYGTEYGKDYWLVKNSWGRLWGDSGYVKMSRNSNNQCGIATDALYPTI